MTAISLSPPIIRPPSSSERRRSRGAMAPIRISELLSLARATDPSSASIRDDQLREMLCSYPLSLASGAGAAMLMAFKLSDQVDAWQLSSWCAAMIATLLCRAARYVAMRRTLRAGQPCPRAFIEVTLMVGVGAALWLIPAFLWFEQVRGTDRVFITLVIIGMMSGGSATLYAVPPAAMTFVFILGLALCRITISIDDWMMTGLSLILSVLLFNSVLSGARMLVRHVRARSELEEQGEMIKLLREFQSSGSDWLWELDAELRVKYLSRGMAESIGRPVEQLVGLTLHALVDPSGEYQLYSDGIRRLFSHIDQGTPFHEIALPTINGRRWYSLSARPVMASDGSVTGWRGVASDITALRSGVGTEAIRTARRDALTGLANRLMVREMIEEARLQQLCGQAPCVLLLLDLDRFKMVNDTLGHAVGDRLLIEVARRLEAACGPDAGVGRLGGDEFAIVWRGSQDSLTLLDVAERIADAIDRAFVIGPSSINVGVSIGIARAPTDGDTEDKLMRSADLALYRSKEQGRGCCTFFEPWMLAKAQADRLLESDVREAVRRGDLHLHYQPIVDAVTYAVIGHEALLRWSHPRRGAIGPDVFVPIIEDVGLIHQIGDWVIREACSKAAHWPTDRHVAVNVSVAQLTGDGLKRTVEEALAETGLAPHRLELEVTENIFLGDDIATLAALASLQSLGVRLVLDDFGKGYSSFGYLSRACFSKIKIDQLFVRGAASGRRESMAIIKSILALASGLGVKTTAEGVETPAQAELLAHLGCTQLQGFLFGRPVPAAAVECTTPLLPDEQPVIRRRRRA